MDYERAIEKVEEYCRLWNIVDGTWRNGGRQYLDTPAYRVMISRMNERLPLVEDIARAVDPGIAERLRTIPGRWKFEYQQAALEELLGRLRGAEESVEILGPSGPQLRARQLHRWIWSAAAELWDDGHHAQAVVAASGQLFDSHLPAKLGVPKAGYATSRIGDAFSTKEAKPGDPRLRFPGFVQGTSDWTSAHEGAAAFGRGCAMGIRNITTHGAQLDEQRALEALAALSLLARWIDEADVQA